MYLSQGLQTLKTIGDVEEKDFSHNKDIKDVKNILHNNLNNLLSKTTKILNYVRIYTEQEIKYCLYNNCSVPISIPINKDLKICNNIIKFNSANITEYTSLLIFGWNEIGYIVLGSWGKDFGDNGVLILPYEYNIDSAWAIQTNENNLKINKTHNKFNLFKQG